MDDSRQLPQVIGSDLLREDPSLAEIVTQFVAGLGERLKGMQNAIRAADFERLRVAAHQLKGSGGGYGYPILTELAAQLEGHARKREIDACVETLEDLKAVCQRVVVDPTR